MRSECVSDAELENERALITETSERHSPFKAKQADGAKPTGAEPERRTECVFVLVDVVAQDIGDERVRLARSEGVPCIGEEHPLRLMAVKMGNSTSAVNKSCLSPPSVNSALGPPGSEELSATVRVGPRLKR